MCVCVEAKGGGGEVRGEGGNHMVFRETDGESVVAEYKRGELKKIDYQ